MVAIDQEGGKVNRLGRIPAWSQIPSAADIKHKTPDSIIAYNHTIATALSKLNINVNLAPVLDPTHDFLGEPAFMKLSGRSFGKNEQEIVPPATAFIEGFSQKGIMCFSKHFPGYDVSSNSDHHIAISQADSTTVLKNTLPFKKTISKVGGVMMSSIHYQKFTNHPSVFSKKIVTWARNMDSEKIIITDDLWGTALRAYVSQKDSVHPIKYPDADFAKLTELAFLAGNDMLMITFPQKVKIMQQTIIQLCKQNPKLVNQIDDSVYRILKAKQSIGLF